MEVVDAVNYRRALVAKHSPKNQCFARQDELLVPAGSQDKMRGKLPKDDHFFVGVESGLPSRYGWVRELDNPITLQDLARLKDGDSPQPETIKSCETLLRAAGKYPEDTPMACHFLEVNLPGERSRRLKVHKVVLYRE